MGIKKSRYCRKNAEGTYDTFHFETEVNQVNGLVEYIRDQTKFFGLNNLKRNQAYLVGDVAYAPSLPTWARLDCTKAGTTGVSEPVWGNVSVGQEITDGTVVWTVRDVKNALYAP